MQSPPKKRNVPYWKLSGDSFASHRAPNELNFSDPTTSQIRGFLINTNYYIYLTVIERQWAQETLLIIQAQKENGKLFIEIWDRINEKGVSYDKQQDHFHLAGDWCVKEKVTTHFRVQSVLLL